MYKTELNLAFYLLVISNKQSNVIEIITEKKKHKNFSPSFHIMKIVHFNITYNFTK